MAVLCGTSVLAAKGPTQKAIDFQGKVKMTSERTKASLTPSDPPLRLGGGDQGPRTVLVVEGARSGPRQSRVLGPCW